MLLDRPIPGHITGLYIFTVINIVILLNVSLVQGDVNVVNILQRNETLARFEDMDANFGPDIPDGGIMGRLVYVIPHNACTPVQPPPHLGPGALEAPWIALIARDDCDFALKVLHAQKASYDMALVHNTFDNDELIKMGGGPYGSQVQIPSVFVGYSNGMKLANVYNYSNKNVLVKVESLRHWDYKMYLWPFAIVIGTCFCLMVIFMIAKWCRDARRRQRSRLSKKHLKKIPIKKFKKGDYYDVCAICLDDYEEGDKMRVLPCSHAYHAKCIDPWLLKNKKTCPVCKRRVMPGKDADADSDSDSDEENGNSTATENTPLLGSSQSRSPACRSTFDTSGLPEPVRDEVSQGSGSRSQEDNSEDSDSVGSEEGAVGGSVPESIEVVVENENMRNVNTNYGYSSDEDVTVVNDKTKKSRKLNQVV